MEDEAQGRLIGALSNEALGQNETGETGRRRPIPRHSPWKRGSGHEEAFLWIPAFAGMTSMGGRYDECGGRCDDYETPV